MKRCSWPSDDPLMIEYHDKEWGVPLSDDRLLFEFLTLESAQAGLSWRTVLHKRENYRKCFSNFDPTKVARFSEKKIAKLMLNAGIIRNEAKIRAAVNNAQRFLEICEEFGSFADYSWRFTDGKPIINKFKTLKELPAQTPLAQEFSKDLKQRGFKFLGPTTVYAHMQASGMVNDHLVSCFRHKECSKIRI